PVGAFPADDILDDVVEVKARLVSDGAADSRQVGYAARYIFETGRVGVVVGPIRDCQARINSGGHALGQLADGNRFIRTDVEGPSPGPRVGHQGQDRWDDVRHMGKAADLRAVAIDLQGPSR